LGGFWQASIPAFTAGRASVGNYPFFCSLKTYYNGSADERWSMEGGILQRFEEPFSFEMGLMDELRDTCVIVTLLLY
jgi:hypothetical protein